MNYHNKTFISEYDNSEKKLLVNYIYSQINISKYKYKLLETTNDLEGFNDSSKYYVSANFSGSNCLLVFCKIRNKNYNFLIDRKTLSFNSEQIKYESVNIMPVNIKLDNSIYNGTIIDGIFIKHDKKKEKFFVITDMYLFRGVSTEKDKINIKLANINTYLEYNMKACQNIILTINKLYEIENIDKLIDEDIKKTRDFHVRGLSFYPEISGTKLIYVFNEDKDKKISTGTQIKELTNEVTKEVPAKSNIIEANKKTKTKYIIKKENIGQQIIFIMELRKTEISDVYKLFVVEEVEYNGKKILKTKKMGIAYIPTKEISFYCKEVFNKNISGRALFKCQFEENRNKWIPLEESKENKIPAKLSDIKLKLEIIEETDTESE